MKACEGQALLIGCAGQEQVLEITVRHAHPGVKVKDRKRQRTAVFESREELS